MNSPGIDQLGHGHLRNAAQPLVIGVGYNRKDQWMVDRDKTVDGVVDDLSLDSCHAVVKLLNRPADGNAKIQTEQRSPGMK